MRPSPITRDSEDGQDIDGVEQNRNSAHWAELRHHDDVAPPHEGKMEGPVGDAETVAAQISTESEPMGRPGRPWDRRAPFWVGMAGAAGVAVTVGLVEVIVTVSSVLLLIGLAFFIAVGLEPAVAWLVRHQFPRWAAVSTVVVAGFALLGGFLASTIPVLVEQVSQLATQLPIYLQSAQDHNSLLGQLNDRFHLQQTLDQTLSGFSVTSLAGGVLGIGLAVFSAIGSTLIVIVLTIYLLADLFRVRAGFYRLAPDSRRPRTILIGDEIFAKVGVTWPSR